MYTERYIKYRQKQGEIALSPCSQLFEQVWAKMQKSGQLDGLNDDQQLESVVTTTDILLKGANTVSTQ